MSRKLIKEQKIGKVKYELLCNKNDNAYIIKVYDEEKMIKGEMTEVPTYGSFPNEKKAREAFDKLVGK